MQAVLIVFAMETAVCVDCIDCLDVWKLWSTSSSSVPLSSSSEDVESERTPNESSSKMIWRFAKWRSNRKRGVRNGEYCVSSNRKVRRGSYSGDKGWQISAMLLHTELERLGLLFGGSFRYFIIVRNSGKSMLPLLSWSNSSKSVSTWFMENVVPVRAWIARRSSFRVNNPVIAYMFEDTTKRFKYMG